MHGDALGLEDQRQAIGQALGDERFLKIAAA
jgi:hypothetical protein